MKNRIIYLAIFVVLFGACQKGAEQKQNKITNDLKFWTWITADGSRADSSYVAEFKKYKQNGLDAVLINTHTDSKLLARLTPIAKKEGLEVHAWIMAMNRPGDSLALQHPDWYAVSREGKSCYDTRPYVDYYQWLCPTRKESRQHVLNLVERLAKVKGITSVHLDYIRFCDIFLPVGLLPKYNLVQNTELPQFDFCYCDVCVTEFMKKHQRDPQKMKHSEIDMEWKQFRLNKIKAVVDEAYKIAHNHNKELSAAVFPYPEMADHMVRQRWDKWNIDQVLPMIYNHFYNEGTDWIGFATAQGIKDLANKKTELHTGIYVPPLSPKELKEAIVQAKASGAKGVAFFDGSAITDEQFKVIKSFK